MAADPEKATLMTEQNEAIPYPERDPKDEAKRLVIGSPSHPIEMDHHLFGGQRDWSKSMKILVAGGGTGDTVVQLAHVLTRAGAPYEITYVDRSKAARSIAEARLAKRKLTGVMFQTGDPLDAAEQGPFDYIDCCGLLHHVEDPAACLTVLESALAPDGSLGFAAHAPFGRSGIFPLQEAMGALLDGLPPEERVAKAKEILPLLPEGHPFRRNSSLREALSSDAGLYDLLLAMPDRAFAVDEWLSLLDAAGLELAGWVTPALYDLSLVCAVPEGMDMGTQAVLAEKLRGTISKHVGYATRKGESPAKITEPAMNLVPHFAGPRTDMAKGIASGHQLKMTVQGVTFRLKLPERAAGVVARVDGRRTLAQIAQSSQVDPVAFQALWQKMHDALTMTGTLRYSTLKPG